MNMLEKLSDPAEWEAYFSYKKENHHLTRAEEEDLRKFIDHEEYRPAVERMLTGGPFPLPEKKQIRKMQTEKKRVVYVYPRVENHLLKLLSFLLIRRYDAAFPPNLYSFRVNSGVRKAVRQILFTPGLSRLYSYKADISNYFNSIDPGEVLGMLRPLLSEEPEVYGLLEQLLTEKRVLEKGCEIEEEKGVMAGTPFAVFLANLYLSDMDREFLSKDMLYARYSDDIIVFSESEEGREEAARRIGEILKEKGLRMNPKKEIRSSPGEPWTFLGIRYDSGTVDVSQVSKEKLKAKIRRKARAIKRWQIRKGALPEQGAKAFIRSMNRKFFDADSGHELTWARWYFPLITTDESLRDIDHYVQYWVRYLISGKHRNKNYEYTYEEMKKLGYLSLVHEWYQEGEKRRASDF